MTFLSCAYRHGCHLVLAANKVEAEVTVCQLKEGARAPLVRERRSFPSRARARQHIGEAIEILQELRRPELEMAQKLAQRLGL